MKRIDKIIRWLKEFLQEFLGITFLIGYLIIILRSR